PAADRRPKRTARARPTEGEGGQMLAGSNLFQDLRNGGAWSGRGDRRDGAGMHQVDHGNGCIRLGKCRGDGRECPWPETHTAVLDRQRQPKKPGSPEGINSLGPEPTLLIVLPGGRRQHTIGYLSCFRKRYLMIHVAPDLDCVVGRRRKWLTIDSRLEQKTGV